MRKLLSSLFNIKSRYRLPASDGKLKHFCSAGNERKSQIKTQQITNPFYAKKDLRKKSLVPLKKEYVESLKKDGIFNPRIVYIGKKSFLLYCESVWTFIRNDGTEIAKIRDGSPIEVPLSKLIGRTELPPRLIDYVQGNKTVQEVLYM